MANPYEKIVIQNGGGVGKCWECKKLRGLRFVTETRNLAAGTLLSFTDVHTYRLCDSCADYEKKFFQYQGGIVIDGRAEQAA